MELTLDRWERISPSEREAVAKRLVTALPSGFAFHRVRPFSLGDRRYEIETAYDLGGVDIGASISHAGCCLTVVEKGDRWFAVEVSGETLKCYEPSSGAVRSVGFDEVRGGTLAGLGFPRPFAFVVPGSSSATRWDWIFGRRAT